MSDTPRTDAASFDIRVAGNPCGATVVYQSFSRQLERELNRANATIAELEQDLCSGTPWQPIEKSPSNEGNFLVTNGSFYHRAELNDDGEWVSYHTNEYLPFTPTHWMEIPELNP